MHQESENYQEYLESFDFFNQSLKSTLEASKNISMIRLTRVFVGQVEEQGYDFASLLNALAEIAHERGLKTICKYLEDSCKEAQKLNHE